MRLTKSEASRREAAVLAFFKDNPKSSVAKMNAALVGGTLTGNPEKMMNIARAYEIRNAASAVAVAPVEQAVVAPAVTPVIESVPAV